MSGVISVTPQAIQANSVMQTVQDSAPVPKKHQSEQTKPQTTTDTVEISRSAQAAVQNAAKAAVDEATETASQTANEARNGDLQAQRLLVKEVVQKVSYR